MKRVTESSNMFNRPPDGLSGGNSMNAKSNRTRRENYSPASDATKPSSPRHGLNDPLIEHLEQNNLPVTLKNYLALAGLSPHKATPEQIEGLPPEMRDEFLRKYGWPARALEDFMG